ncbi:MAG: hypothetical protein RLZ12_436 [Bacillota bacterium]|jgi:hypothetical protein
MLPLNHDQPIPNIVAAAFSYDATYLPKLNTSAYFTICTKSTYITYLGTLVADHSRQKNGYITIKLLETHNLIPSGSLLSFAIIDIALITLKK